MPVTNCSKSVEISDQPTIGTEEEEGITDLTMPSRIEQSTSSSSKINSFIQTLIIFISFILCSVIGGDSVIITQSILDIIDYYRTLYYFLVSDGSISDCPYFKDRLHAQCHIYSISLIFKLWHLAHYRNGTFHQDMLNNLYDTAIPGTGIPISFFAYSKITTYFGILCIYPFVSFISAIYICNRSMTTFFEQFAQQLIEPQDWFSFWRLNCRLATYHAHSTPHKEDYELEDKWTFLQQAQEKNVSVSPFMKCDGIVCKHRNMEGGLGFESYTNASAGGDWIIQQKLKNGAFLKQLLPKDAPLSTFRIISASRGGLYGLPSSQYAKDKEVVIDDIAALSCVWRAGRAKAKTDHSAILFNVNPKSGEIMKGTTNTHWYQRGLDKIFTTPWISEHNYTNHPDTDKKLTGVMVPNMKQMMDFVRDAHLKLIPYVPLCGWDVALTKDHGMLLLEGNFSCNFFRGDFDQSAYFQFVYDYFVALEDKE